MYKVFKVWDEAKGKDGYQIFWCPSAPLYFTDKIPYSEKIYPQKQGAYRKLTQVIMRTSGTIGWQEHVNKQRMEEASDDTQPRKAAERQDHDTTRT